MPVACTGELTTDISHHRHLNIIHTEFLSSEASTPDTVAAQAAFVLRSGPQLWLLLHTAPYLGYTAVGGLVHVCFGGWQLVSFGVRTLGCLLVGTTFRAVPRVPGGDHLAARCPFACTLQPAMRFCQRPALQCLTGRHSLNFDPWPPTGPRATIYAAAIACLLAVHQSSRSQLLRGP